MGIEWVLILVGIGVSFTIAGLFINCIFSRKPCV